MLGQSSASLHNLD
ncbi:hypothetical protein VULLAG_LOCUS4956 [Vulpes lagopus]